MIYLRVYYTLKAADAKKNGKISTAKPINAKLMFSSVVGIDESSGQESKE